MLRTLGEAFVLVVIVVFLFLGNLRATVIPAIAVPVSLIGTFAVLLVLGYSANTVSLLAMVLAIGIVVDDAIVVVENVERVMEEEPDLSPAEATKKAMAQITAPIIAITLVLLSVFVPIAFIPGISGDAVSAVRGDDQRCHADLGDERADAVAGAVRACSCVTPGRGAASWAASSAASTGCATATLAASAGWCAWPDCRCCSSRSSPRGIFGMSQVTPTGFLPEEDQGAFFTSVQLPDGASVARTSEVTRQVEDLLKQMPQVDHVLAVIGFSLLDGASQPNSALVVTRLKPFDDRKAAANSAQALIARTFAAGAQIRQANVLPFNLPPIIGLSTAGGFEYQLEALEGQSPAEISSVTGALIGAANADPRLARVFSTFTATNPSVYLDIDRRKAQALGLTISDVFTALQATLGGIYVNNFNLFGRTWQVNVQGEAFDRADISDILADLRTQQHRRDGAFAIIGRHQDRDRAAGHHPLQQLSLGDGQRQPGAGSFLRHGDRRDG